MKLNTFLDKINKNFVIVLAFFCSINISFCKAIFEKKIVAIITSLNNAQWYQKNLDSVFSQNYYNYRVIYIDDNSTDGTHEFVRQYLKERSQEHRTTLIKNNTWVSQMANHYKAAHMCDDDEIIVHLDGDDWLAHENVLSFLNSIYSNNDVWLTYGQSILWPQNSPGVSLPIPPGTLENNSFRTHWHYGHLRTFYAWLFKQIKLKDLLYKGSFIALSPAPDAALMYPMLEMANKHVQFIPDVLYVWNLKNPISQYILTPDSPSYNIFKLVDKIKKWPPYTPLKTEQISPKNSYQHKQADIIFISDNAIHLQKIVENYYKHFLNINTINIINFNTIDSCTITEIEALHPKIRFFRFLNNGSQDLSIFLKNIISDLREHIILAKNEFMPCSKVNISECIQILEQTFGFGFYFSLIPEDILTPPYVFLNDRIIAWQYKYGNSLWIGPQTFEEYRAQTHHTYIQYHNEKTSWQDIYNFNVTLYRKNDIMLILEESNCRTLQELLAYFDHQNTIMKSSKEIGLCHKQRIIKPISIE